MEVSIPGVGKYQMKVVSYIATLPSKLLSGPHDTDRKYQTLCNYSAGVSVAGDHGLVVREMRYQPSEVAMMLGWVHEHGKTAPHLSFRQQILDQQRANGRRTVIADSNLFLYKNSNNPHYYLRYSFDGVFPNTGEYCDQTPDPRRWMAIKRDMGVDLQPWRTQGNHLLLCLQRNGGWSMGASDVVTWAVNTIKTLRQYSNRPVVIRVHPGDKGAGRDSQTILSHCQQLQISGISLSPLGKSLVDDLHNCWAVVNHNSSPAVAAVIEGIPVFVTDPTRSQAQEVANTDFSLIETPNMPNREPWIYRISQFHWSFDDLLTGRCWNHMKNWATS